MTRDPDLQACAELLQKADPDRFAAVMACPLNARKILFPLYAFNVEVARAPWVTAEPMIAEMRLQWWRDALDEIAAGKIPRRHQVVTPLSHILDPTDAARLDRLVAARRWDIYKEPFEDEAHLDRYLDETGAGLMWTAARALGSDRVNATRSPYKGAETENEQKVRTLGQASALARFLQAVPALEKAGRVPLVDGRKEAVAERARKALLALRQTRPDRKSLPPVMRPALKEAFLAEAILTQATDHPHRIAQGTLAVHPVKRSLLLWRMP